LKVVAFQFTQSRRQAAARTRSYPSEQNALEAAHQLASQLSDEKKSRSELQVDRCGGGFLVAGLV